MDDAQAVRLWRRAAPRVGVKPLGLVSDVAAARVGNGRPPGAPFGADLPRECSVAVPARLPGAWAKRCSSVNVHGHLLSKIDEALTTDGPDATCQQAVASGRSRRACVHGGMSRARVDRDAPQKRWSQVIGPAMPGAAAPGRRVEPGCSSPGPWRTARGVQGPGPPGRSDAAPSSALGWAPSSCRLRRTARRRGRRQLARRVQLRLGRAIDVLRRPNCAADLVRRVANSQPRRLGSTEKVTRDDLCHPERRVARGQKEDRALPVAAAAEDVGVSSP